MPRIATRCICCDNPALERQSAVLMPFVAQRAFGWTRCEVTADWGLRDLPTGHAHALCSTLHCSDCGLVFLDMRFDDDEMARLYHDYRGTDYEALRESLEPGYALRNQRLVAGDAHIPAVESFLRAWVPTQPAILDWGGDTGLNTPLRQQARRHDVLEISGKPLVAGAAAVDEAGLAGSVYDLIVLSHVLEHVPEPAELLRRIRGVMPPAGSATRLYVEVPFEPLMRAATTDPQAWRRKRHWHEHVNFFSAESLERLFAGCGLRPLAASQIDLPGDPAAVVLATVCEPA